jgi:hypothetical protein
VEEDHRQYVLHVHGRIGRVARVIGDGFFAIGILVLFAGTAAGFMRGQQIQTVYVKWTLWISLGAVVAFGVYRAIWGGNLQQIRGKLGDGIRRLLTKWFTPASRSA